MNGISDTGYLTFGLLACFSLPFHFSFSLFFLPHLLYSHSATDDVMNTHDEIYGFKSSILCLMLCLALHLRRLLHTFSIFWSSFSLSIWNKWGWGRTGEAGGRRTERICAFALSSLESATSGDLFLSHFPLFPWYGLVVIIIPRS